MIDQHWFQLDSSSQTRTCVDKASVCFGESQSSASGCVLSLFHGCVIATARNMNQKEKLCVILWGSLSKITQPAKAASVSDSFAAKTDSTQHEKQKQQTQVPFSLGRTLAQGRSTQGLKARVETTWLTACRHATPDGASLQGAARMRTGVTSLGCNRCNDVARPQTQKARESCCFKFHLT